MKTLKLWVWIVSSFFIFMFVACGGRSDSNGTGGGTGILSLSLTDTPTDEFQAVYVTIDEVQAHMDGGNWQMVASPSKTYNLLDLVNGVLEKLGTTSLETGLYTQMKLIIGKTPDGEINLLGDQHPYANYIIDTSGASHELKIPSGFQTGVKLVHPFEIIEGLTTELILDFDASKSIVKAGNSGQYLLKPTIKVIGTIDNAVVSGRVTDDADNGLGGALVTAQVYNAAAEDEKDQVVVESSTFTDVNGDYTMYLEPGTYYIVAYKGTEVEYGPAYGPGCATIVAESNTEYTQDFALSDALTGNITGHVTITHGVVDQHVTLSFRQLGVCEGGAEEIEVTSLDVTDGASYTATLPVETYRVLASTDGRTTQDFEVEVDTDTELDITFPVEP